MRTQVNSDTTVAVDASLTRFVKDEASRILETTADKVTRLEIHLSDVNSRKSGPADKRCVVEARPAGEKPISTSATANKLAAAIVQALEKMQRKLTSLFGRRGRATAPATKARATPKRASTPRSAKGTAASGRSPVSRSPAKRSSIAAAGAKSAKAAKSPATKSAASSKAAASGKTGTVAGKTPKKKAIFQARRKAWPTRQA